MAIKKRELELLAQGKGCLGKAADNEPVFILRGQDMSADILVDLWCELNRDTASADKLTDARALAAAMRAWPTRKRPT